MGGTGGRCNAHRVLVGRLEGRMPLGGPSCRWEDTVKIELKVTEWGALDWDKWWDV